MVPSTFLLTYFWAFLGGLGRGGAPGTVPLQKPQVTSRKACLRHADRNRAGTGTVGTVFPKPKAEPEPTEPLSRNRSRNRIDKQLPHKVKNMKLILPKYFLAFAFVLILIGTDDVSHLCSHRYVTPNFTFAFAFVILKVINSEIILFRFAFILSMVSYCPCIFPCPPPADVRLS